MSGFFVEGVEQACAAGRCPEAIDLLEQAVRSQPSNFRLHHALGVCYSGSCCTHALTHPDIAAQYLRHALELLGAEPRLTRAAILDALGNTLRHSRGLPAASALEASIDCHRAAAEIYQSLGMADDWGRTQFNLGNSCCDLSEITGEDHWQEAVAHYQESLRVRTLEKDPERHAAVLENLGSAFRRLPCGGNGNNVRKSIQCYRRALRIYAPATHPGKSAALQSNLGNAYLSLPDTDQSSKERNTRRALRHFGCALRVQSQDKGSRAYGITQYNRAQAYYRLAQASPGGNPKVALKCLEEAFAAFQSCGEDRYTQLVRAQLERLCRQ
jgi:tetratricopeptide (TPR) repeat protein